MSEVEHEAGSHPNFLVDLSPRCLFVHHCKERSAEDLRVISIRFRQVDVSLNDLAINEVDKILRWHCVLDLDLDFTFISEDRLVINKLLIEARVAEAKVLLRS